MSAGSPATADERRSTARASYASIPASEQLPSERPIHPSLVRPTLYLGVERHVIGVEGTLCLAVLFGVGVSLVSAGLIALIVLVVHPVMAWATSDDPQSSEVYLRSHAYADYYAPHSEVHAAVGTPRPSVPRAG